ncbi:hypothetical protein AKJ09_05690 [Labilithrix luteola]|uniref:Uncharacterized protein n=1 Tax=Labilithrix luteola TaxID=1391654 RepID=A0A0K1Q061_9BACT|nr:hypothetical protein AKJ09_05690 [Labilithrix luteola]
MLNYGMPLAACMALLVGCGGSDDPQDEIHYEDRVVEVPGEVVTNRVEYMPIDGFVLGFWTMDTDANCTGPCLNDHSAYGNSLYLGDMAFAPVTQAPTQAGDGAVDEMLHLDGNVQASTIDGSVLNDTLVGERFSVLLRARTQADELHTLFSLGTASSTALNVQLSRHSLLVELPRQQKRLLVPLSDASTWQEIQLASDGERVTLQVGCTQVASFDRAPGQPILSNAATGVMVGARWGEPASDAFTGDVDLVRVSRQSEANLFCSK